jgi:hypothetical protein
MIDNQNFSYLEGKSATIQVTVVDGDGTLLDMSDWTGTWVLRQGSASGTLIVTKTEATGITLTEGLAEIEIYPADTEGLSGEYYHELAISNGVDNYPLLTGIITLSASGT